IAASLLSFLLYPFLAQAVASQLDAVALSVIKGDVSQYMQNFFNFNSLLFSFFVSQTYASLYQQQ
ncbi:tyrP-A, partial [Symbiodinium pilosum]